MNERLLYENRGQPPLSRRSFARRMGLHAGVVLLILAASLAIGMAGYMGFEDLPWQDAFVNAAMLLGGMGPVNALKTNAGKIFAGCYALYAGLVFIVSTGVILAPVVHRVLHKFNSN
ncbi:MAG TPA: hypothetical protein VF943_14045 [Burkholderiales bacterium]